MWIATTRHPTVNWGRRLILDMMNGEKIIPMEKDAWRKTARMVGERETPGKIKRVSA